MTDILANFKGQFGKEFSMSDRWGHCQGCGCSTPDGPYCQSCEGNEPDGKCDECGCAFEYDVDTCLEHLESAEDLRKYAGKLVEKNRSFNAKIDGGVETLKERDKEIENLKEGIKALSKGLEDQISTINILLAEKLGLIGG